MILVDAGPLIAVLDHKDAEHKRCVRVLAELPRPFVSTWAVVTEVFHVLGGRAGWRSQEGISRMIDQRALILANLVETDMPRIRDLMSKYQSVPMDIADATLVVIAERMQRYRIFTLDSDFQIYRTRDRRAFEVVPAP